MLSTKKEEFIALIELKLSKLTEEEISEDVHQSAVENIVTAIRSEVTVTYKGGMQVIAEASQLQSYDSKAITHVKIKIHEDGMVWAGKTGQETLIPE